MDKSQWPQEWKNQYNSVVRKRALKKRLEDDWRCPEIWKFNLTEENVFSMLGHCFPFNRTIKRIIGRFYQKENSKQLLVSTRYMHETRRVYPAYYSDRERIIVQLNRYLERGDLEQFIKWLPFYEKNSHLHLVHLIIGVFFLDLYLSNLRNQDVLEIAIEHLEKGKANFQTMNAHLAFTSLIAFGHYMNQDFDSSLEYLDHVDENAFHRDFDELIRKVA